MNYKWLIAIFFVVFYGFGYFGIRQSGILTKEFYYVNIYTASNWVVAISSIPGILVENTVNYFSFYGFSGYKLIFSVDGFRLNYM